MLDTGSETWTTHIWPDASNSLSSSNMLYFSYQSRRHTTAGEGQELRLGGSQKNTWISCDEWFSSENLDFPSPRQAKRSVHCNRSVTSVDDLRRAPGAIEECALKEGNPMGL